ILFAPLVLLANLNKSNPHFSGFILNSKDNKPIKNATITLVDLKLSVLSDSNGMFTFINLKNGQYLLEVKCIGFKNLSKNIIINDTLIEVFKLEESIMEINEIVVTGTSKATQIKRNPVPIVVLNRENLITNINTNAIESITRLAGVKTVTTGPNISKPFIRGLGFNRILTLYDGIRQEGQQWGDEHGVEIDQYAVNRIEVIKGPASLSYGSDALAGVVNLIPTQPAPEGKILGDLLTEYQSNNKLLGNSFNLSSTKNGLEWLVRFSNKIATNYTNKVDGPVNGTGFNETDFNTSIGVHKKWGYSHIDFVFYDNKQEVPDGIRDSATWKFTKPLNEFTEERQIISADELNSYSINSNHQRIQHYRIFWANKFLFNNGANLLVNIGAQNNIRREYEFSLDPNNQPTLYLDLSTYTYDIKYNVNEINNGYFTVGINGFYQKNISTKGTEFVIPNYHILDIGYFANFKKTYNKLDILGGIRFDTRNIQTEELLLDHEDHIVYTNNEGVSTIFNNQNTNFNGLSWSLGTSYNFNSNWAVKLNIASGYRAPNIAEFTSNGVHQGTNFFQIGNNEFKPEISIQQDLGIIYSSKILSFELNVFNNFINNFIYNQKLNSVFGGDSVVHGSNAIQTFKYQNSNAQLYGGEFSFDIHPFKHVHLSNSLSILYGENKGHSNIQIPDNEKYLPFISPTLGSTELKYEFESKKWIIKNGYIKIQMDYAATQDKIFSAYNTETVSPGYTLFNVGMGATFRNKSNKNIVNLYVTANNIFDIAYWDHLSRLKYLTNNTEDSREHGIYNMGRNISIKLIFPIDINLKK
ncbi:MAG: TonB-dependent receptor, partial [Sediminibacterium sp.]|nr:TonB-dependent receptor [Sediminibacterium sp.]